MRIKSQRRYVIVIALILLHLAAFSQEKKYVKKTLTPPLDSTQLSKSRLLQSPLLQSPGASMGFFCRQEYKMEKIARVPIKIRLGTYQEAQRLEYGVKVR